MAAEIGPVVERRLDETSGEHRRWHLFTRAFADGRSNDAAVEFDSWLHTCEPETELVQVLTLPEGPESYARIVVVYRAPVEGGEAVAGDDA